MKLLIVDEIGFIRQSLTQKLARHDFQTIAAASGEEALSVLNTDFAVDAVLTSLFLPSMNAIELFKSAIKIERFNDQGVIPPLHFYLMVTREHGTSSPKMKELTREALAIGFRDLLVKPIDVELFVRKLQNAAQDDTEPAEEKESPKKEVREPIADPKLISKRAEGLTVMQHSLHALKKEMCESIDILLEEVTRKAGK